MKTYAGWVLGAALATSAVGAPFEAADVAADAAWVVHLDAEGLGNTRIGDFLLEEMAGEEAAAKLAAIKLIFHFDLREDLAGATLYGVNDRPEGSVAVLRGRLDPEWLVSLVKANPTYQTSAAGPATIHSWIDDSKPAANRTYAGFHGSDTLVISEGRDRVALALAVLDGTADSLQQAGGLADFVPGAPDPFFVAAANLSDLPEASPQAAILRQARAMRVALSAPGDDLEAHVGLTVDSPRTAEQVAEVLAGIRAFAQLNHVDQPELAALAETLRITRDGGTVECWLRHPIEPVVEHLRREAERKRSETGS